MGVVHSVPDGDDAGPTSSLPTGDLGSCQQGHLPDVLGQAGHLPAIHAVGQAVDGKGQHGSSNNSVLCSAERVSTDVTASYREQSVPVISSVQI